MPPFFAFACKRKKQGKSPQTQQLSQKTGLSFYTKIKMGLEETGGKRRKREHQNYKLNF